MPAADKGPDMSAYSSDRAFALYRRPRHLQCALIETVSPNLAVGRPSVQRLGGAISRDWALPSSLATFALEDVTVHVLPVFLAL